MPNYITVSEVRRTVGIQSEEISDSDVEGFIDEVEDQIPRFFNTAYTPQERIEFLDGNHERRINVNKTPLLSIREIIVDDTSVTIDGNTNFSSSGIVGLDLDGNPEKTYFSYGDNNIKIRYVFGKLEEKPTTTTTTSETSPGTSVAIDVDDETSFSVGDWITIRGMDGEQESAKITSTSTGQITVDELAYTHQSDSKIILIEIKEIIKRLMRIVVSISMVARIVGESYEEIVGYSLSDFSVQKGEPYTQWRETGKQLIKERDRIYERIKPAFAIK